MSYFLPSFFQKRLLRYALSRLELVDTDALDLDSLGIKWGQRSTFELRDVGLRLEKLSSILSLPPTCNLTKARIAHLRVTIPADIYSSSISIEVEGVHIHLKLLPDEVAVPKPPTHDHEAQNILPSTTDLAQSFLESEPQGEKAELKAAISSQSQYLHHPGAFNEDDEEELGLGQEGVALPSFVAGFLKGIGDRLQVNISDVQLRLDMEVRQDGFPKGQSAGKPDPVTALLSIQNIAVDGVRSSSTSEETDTADTTVKIGRRLITLSKIQALLISDPAIFSNYSRFTAPESPSTAHSKASQSQLQSFSPPPTIRSSSSSAVLAMSQSTILDPSQDAHLPHEPVEESVFSTTGRFSDAGTEEEYGHDPYLDDEILSDDERLLDNPSYLEEAINSQMEDDIEDSAILRPELSNPSAQESGVAAQNRTAESGPSSPRDDSYDDDEPPKDLLEESSASLKDQMSDSIRPKHSEGHPESEPMEASQHSSAEGNEGYPLSGSVGSVDQQAEDLSESKLFTHEEAESMYMSATSNATSSKSYMPAMPGAWGSPTLTAQEPRSPHRVPDKAGGDLEGEAASTPKPTPHPGNLSLDEDLGESSHSLGSPRFPAQNASQIASEEAPLRLSPEKATEVSKRIIEIDCVSIWIPSNSQPAGQPTEISDDPPSRRTSNDMKRSTVSISEHDEVSGPSTARLSSRKHRDSTASAATFEALGQSAIRPLDKSTFVAPHEDKSSENIEVEISSANVHFDIAAGWLLVKMGQRVTTAWKPEKSADEDVSSTESSPSIAPLSLSLKNFSLKFLGYLPEEVYSAEISSQEPTTSFTSDEEIILKITMSGVRFQSIASKNPKLQIEVSRFSFGDASEDIISFDEDLRMRESTRDILSPGNNDISISVTLAQDSTKVDFNTLPVHVSLNLQKIDEVISWFGGLSTILELGSSIASMSTVRGGKTEVGQRPRGVHFEPVSTNTPTPAKSSPHQWKTNARIGGIVVDLIGEHCGIKLTTTAVKVISRYELIGLQIDKAKITGPHCFDYGNETAAKISLGNIRVEYLFTPKEVDLDRLLSLLTPSKDKYDEDDDIMLDTLVRQRKQGSVLRVTVEAVKSIVSRLDRLEELSQLGAELAKLSSVAKYLPEDDRAGILTLGLIRELDARVHIGGEIGDIRLTSRNFEVAHVSLPSLIAAQMASIGLLRNGDEELVGEALPASSGTFATESPPPMVMVRLVADEMEPTIKFKLCNLRAEYTVSSMMAVLGIRDDVSAEDLAANMAHSVLNLADLPNPPADRSRRSNQSTSGSESSKALSKPTKVAVSLRDCIIGLNPRGMPSKGLAVFTFAKFQGTMHKDESSMAIFDIRKAALMIIDDVQKVDPNPNPPGRRPSTPQTGYLRQLSSMGYVAVCNVSSAVATVKVMQLDANGEKSLDVEVKDDLLILETCADSTQTLVNLLNGLKPPTPPNTDLKYRTEVMPLQDMLESFSGDAFATDPVSEPEGLSDHVEVNAEDEESEELEYVSDFYPYRTAGGLGSGNDLAGSDEMDAGLASFHTDAHVSSSVSELEFQDDHFTKKSAVGGTAHRWDSTRNTYGLANEIKLHGSPLRVRVRDVHVIWNLFDGYDWQRTRDEISKMAKDVESRAQERWANGPSSGAGDDDEPVTMIGDYLFNSIYIGIPAHKDPHDLSHNINHEIDDFVSETGSFATSTTVTGATSRQNHTPKVKGKRLRLARSKYHKMAFELKGISADLVVFPPGSGETQSSLDIRVHDLEIFDHVPTSTWKKFATYMHDAGERESGTSMVHIEILNVKPVPDLAASEIVLKASVLPLRLHVDQDALDFMSRFFEFRDNSAPVPSSPGDIPFIQRAEVNAISVKLDFKPKRVDYAGLRSGRTTEFMNFFVLDEADMVLRKVIIYGISGFDRLGLTLNDIWMPDVKSNQLPGVLAGLAPIRSLVNVGSGVKDLVVIPMREYKKDGRVVRSIQKGAVAFAKTTTNELVKLGAKMAIGTQTVLQGAEEFLNPSGQGSSSAGASLEGGRWEDASVDDDEKKQISLYADQPVGVVQGLRGAYSSLERDLLMTRDAIVAVPGEIVESGSARNAAMTVIKRTPTVILRPAIGASKAIGQTLLGAGNSLDPTNRRRVEDKYKRH
ncbi:autophagy- protein 2 [Arachnomyces sp. PD_36]|nr:autophagy- protein 2 [Arachnomyces sp. PD_36]